MTHRTAVTDAAGRRSSARSRLLGRWGRRPRTDEPTVTHRYRSSKTYDARVEVTDNLGLVTVTHVEVRVRG